MISLRTCAYSYKKDIKTNFLRVVKLPDGTIKVDKYQNIKGRGAYLCKDKNIIELAEAKNSLARVLRSSVDKQIYDELLTLL